MWRWSLVKDTTQFRLSTLLRLFVSLEAATSALDLSSLRSSISLRSLARLGGSDVVAKGDGKQ